MVLASRADDLDRLAQLLRESGRATATLLPRERVLVRAFRRMIAAGGSVYRRQGRRDEPAGEGALRAWASAMAPAAAGFVDGTGAGESAGGEVPLEAPSREAHEALERDQGARGAAGTKARGRRIGALVAAWAVLAAGVFACLEILAPVGRGAHGASADELPTSLVSSFGGGLFSLVVLAMGGLVVARLRRSDRAGARLQAATRHAAKGDLDAAVAVYRELLVGAQNPMTKASAHLGLADVAEERASFDEALREVDLGIGLLEGQKTWRAAASDILLPELHGARAWLLARAGRTDEANAELALVARDFPTYPFATRTRHRVRLVAAVTAGDLDAARDLVRRRAPEMPLSVRDELLGDLVLATADPTTPEGERERLATDLREDARLAAWLAAVAPRLAGALAGGPSVRLAEVAEVEAAVADESDPGAARAREV